MKKKMKSISIKKLKRYLHSSLIFSILNFCKLRGNLNITTSNKSNINSDIPNTRHMLVYPIKAREDRE